MRYFRASGAPVVICALIVLGCSAGTPQEPSLAQTALEAQLMAQATSVSTAVSALDSLAVGDTEAAKSALEGLLSSELTKMYALRRELKGEDQSVVDGAMRDAEEYARRHNLKIVKPSP
jgi:hypothetical protein